MMKARFWIAHEIEVYLNTTVPSPSFATDGPPTIWRIAVQSPAPSDDAPISESLDTAHLIAEFMLTKISKHGYAHYMLSNAPPSRWMWIVQPKSRKLLASPSIIKGIL